VSISRTAGMRVRVLTAHVQEVMSVVMISRGQKGHLAVSTSRITRMHVQLQIAPVLTVPALRVRRAGNINLIKNPSGRKPFVSPYDHTH
jgi:hypothetical protein